ncbi:alpha/beta fold hydrolase [Tumebacillus permanentifrigoris]|uniref:Pimeloyl-ACP methyl ester carboxylesterase n=1 Tax=Tumebacillus permanentifrigoris TaxID=378543 RepID=A0A316D8L4_9BACL|nr:alpha/beta hydrolase [Tumebacillus permanentifrigoris]PWK13017.1 pimeloyl-ACP methyl ester carboxylesterase [Tumebacillus permanentifrigoris]
MTSKTYSGAYEKGLLSGSGIYYERMGLGTPIVLLHGLNLDTRMWDGIFEELAQEFQVIRMDIPMFGLSPAKTQEFALYEDIRTMLDELEIEQAYFVGHSMGGMVALEFVCAHPERVLGVVSAYGGLMGHPHSEQIQHASQRIQELKQAGELEELLAYDITTLLDGPTAEPGRVQGDVRERVKAMRVHALSLPAGNFPKLLDPPPIARLEEIQAPLLSIYGDLDWPDFAEVSQVLVDRMPHAQRVLMEGTAHMGPMEKPAEFVRLVKGFVQQ